MQILDLLGVYFLMIQWYLSRRLHFYSDWLWPYCEVDEKKTCFECCEYVLSNEIENQLYRVPKLGSNSTIRCGIILTQ